MLENTSTAIPDQNIRSEILACCTFTFSPDIFRIDNYNEERKSWSVQSYKGIIKVGERHTKDFEGIHGGMFQREILAKVNAV